MTSLTNAPVAEQHGETPLEKKYHRTICEIERRWPGIAASAQHPLVEASSCGPYLSTRLDKLITLILCLIIFPQFINGPKAYVVAVVVALTIAVYNQGKEFLYPSIMRRAYASKRSFLGGGKFLRLGNMQELWLTGVSYRTMAAEAVVRSLMNRMHWLPLLMALLGAIAFAVWAFYSNNALAMLLPFLPTLLGIVFYCSIARDMIIVSSALSELRHSMETSRNNLRGAFTSFRFWRVTAVFVTAVVVTPAVVIAIILTSLKFSFYPSAVDIATVSGFAMAVLCAFQWRYGDFLTNRIFERSVAAGTKTLNALYEEMEKHS